MSFLLSFARLLWHPIYIITRPCLRLITRYQVGKVRETDLVSEQKNRFQEAELDWVSANRIVTDLIGPHTDLKSHRSQHYELVVAIGKQIQLKRVLEIGTADASFTSFLARAFPDSIIETIDLAAGDPRFWNATDNEVGTEENATGGLKSESPELKIRTANLHSSSNIVFREMNSLELSRFDEHKFDLIWVDGDHTFPVVACDIANAIRLLESDGVMMCDDIFFSAGQKNRWGKQESYNTLNAFEKAGLIQARFVLKSIRPEKNYSSRVTKHLAVVKLTE